MNDDHAQSVREGLLRSVGRLEGKLDSLIEIDKTAHADIAASVKTLAERTSKKLDNHEERISTLERRNWYERGIWATVASAALLFGHKIQNLLGGSP